MALTDTDRVLLQRCFKHQSGAWNDFVDRFLGLVYHVIHYTAHLRSARLSPEDVEDIAADVMLQIVQNDYAVLRSFRQQSSLAAYLTVIARRICVHELNRRLASIQAHTYSDGQAALEREADDRPRVEAGLEGLEEVQKLLRKLPNKREREVVRLFYLEGRTYEEISTRLHIPVNTIGPILSKARKTLRARAAAKAAKQQQATPENTKQIQSDG